jgi:hypothetical protein
MDSISPAPIISRTPEGQFAPGCSGNPRGRPIGSRNRASVMAEALEEGEPAKLIREYADAAHGGDKVALRFCVGRLVPPVRGRTIVLDLPEGMELDFRRGYQRVARAVFDGEITPEEGLTLVRLLAAGKNARFMSPLPLPGETSPPLASEADEEEEEDESSAGTAREIALLQEIARLRLAMKAEAAAPSTTAAAAAEPAAAPTATNPAPPASPPPPVAAPAATAAKPADEPAPPAPSSAAPAAPPQRRHFGTIVRQPEVLAAKLAIV